VLRMRTRTPMDVSRLDSMRCDPLFPSLLSSFPVPTPVMDHPGDNQCAPKGIEYNRADVESEGGSGGVD
jgi:hypothetical protein